MTEQKLWDDPAPALRQRSQSGKPSAAPVAVPVQVGEVVEFKVFGEFQQKGSARGFAIPIKGSARDQRGNEKFRSVITTANPKLQQWEGSVRFEAALAAAGRFFAQDVPVALVLEFHIPRPKSVPASARPFPTVVPDWDKLARAVSDALSSVLYHDDRQVVTAQVRKRYTDGPSYLRVTARIETEP